MLKKLSVVLVVFVLASCAGKIAMNPQEAREVLVDGKQFTVNGDYNKTVKRLNRLAYSCLNKTVQGSRQTVMSHQVYKYSYAPTVKVGSQKTEMYVQYDPGGLKLVDIPEKGAYALVVDVFNKGSGKIDVAMYTSNWYSDLNEAVEGWLRGENEMCPDL